MRNLTHQELLQRLEYDVVSGDFRWIEPLHPRISIGSVAGFVSPYGYVVIKIAGQAYQAHRLAWLYVTGRWPANDIDHRDTVRNNNRWSNLREATKAQNGQNRRVAKNNTTGVKGVGWNRRLGKYQAVISANGVQKYLGIFDKLEDAKAARQKAAAELHGRYLRFS